MMETIAMREYFTVLFPNASNSNPKITGRLVYHPERDYGYPNIAWTGVYEKSQIQCLIGFNYTSTAGHPGVGAVH